MRRDHSRPGGGRARRSGASASTPSHGSLTRRVVLALVALVVTSASVAGLLVTRTATRHANHELASIEAAATSIDVMGETARSWTDMTLSWSGLADDGARDARAERIAQRLMVGASTDPVDPCVRMLADRVGALDPALEVEERWTEIDDAAFQLSEFCGRDVSGQPELERTMSGLVAIQNTHYLIDNLLFARAVAGVDQVSDDALDSGDLAWATEDPQLGLPADIVDLRTSLLEQVDDPSVVPDDVETLPGADVLAAELAWLTSSDGWMTEQAHPALPDLLAAYDSFAQGVRDRLLADLAPSRDAAEEAVRSATTWRAVAVAAAAVTGLGLLVSLVLIVATTVRRLRDLRTRAESDDLTGIANRAAARWRSAGWFDDPMTAVGVMVIDLDHFKRFNDELGHAAGDEVLVATARRLVEHVVDATTAVCRWGGDEFVVVLRLDRPRASDEDRDADLDAIVRRLHDAITQPVDVGGGLVSVGATIGAAVCRCGTCDFDDLFRAADRVLYEVKSAGRNRHGSAPCLSAASGSFIPAATSSTAAASRTAPGAACSR